MEVVAGATTFLAMAQIIFVKPAILNQTGVDKQALIIVACIVMAVITIIKLFAQGLFYIHRVLLLDSQYGS